MKTASEIIEDNEEDGEVGSGNHLAFKISKIKDPVGQLKSEISFGSLDYFNIVLNTKSGTRYSCKFYSQTLSSKLQKQVNGLHLFSDREKNSFLLNAAQELELEKVFLKIKDELHSSYCYKDQLLKTYLWEVLHYVLKHLKTEEPATFV